VKSGIKYVDGMDLRGKMRERKDSRKVVRKVVKRGVEKNEILLIS